MSHFRKWLEIFSVVSLLLMSTHIVGNALGRRLLRTPIEGTMEITKFWYMPALVLVGLVAAELTREHIAANVLFDRLPLGIRNVLRYIGGIAASGLFLAFAVLGMKEAAASVSFFETGGLVNLPIWPVKVALPVFFLILAGTTILNLFRRRSSNDAS